MAREELLQNVHFVIYEVNEQFKKDKSFKSMNKRDLFKTPFYHTKENKIQIAGATLILYNRNRISLKGPIIKNRRKKGNQVGFNSVP